MTVFAVGCLARFERDQYGWRSGSSQLQRGKELRRGSNLFHVSILLLFVGHFVGLLTPPQIYHALGLSTSAKQVLAVIAGGIFGSVCLTGIYTLIRRRLYDPRIRANSSRMDIHSVIHRRAADARSVDLADLAVSLGRQQHAAVVGMGSAYRDLAAARRT